MKVLPKKRGVGTVDVVIATADGAPEQALVDQVQAVLEEQREIAVDVQVQAPETVAVHLILSVKPAAGASAAEVIRQVEGAMETWFDGQMLGRDLLLVQIAQKIYEVEGVENYRLLAPAADLAAEDGTLPMLGRVTVTEMEADDDV